MGIIHLFPSSRTLYSSWGKDSDEVVRLMISIKNSLEIVIYRRLLGVRSCLKIIFIIVELFYHCFYFLQCNFLSFLCFYIMSL